MWLLFKVITASLHTHAYTYTHPRSSVIVRTFIGIMCNPGPHPYPNHSNFAPNLNLKTPSKSSLKSQNVLTMLVECRISYTVHIKYNTQVDANVIQIFLPSKCNSLCLFLCSAFGFLSVKTIYSKQ